MTLSVTLSRLGSPATGSRPVLVLGPSLGTSAQALWAEVGTALAEQFTVLAWDLPGHGQSPPSHGGYTIAELSDAVLAAVADAGGQPFAYAGASIGGVVGLQLLLDHPGWVHAAILLCTGARIGSAESWTQRAAFVRANGTAAIVAGSLNAGSPPVSRNVAPLSPKPCSTPCAAPTPRATPTPAPRWRTSM